MYPVVSNLIPQFSLVSYSNSIYLNYVLNDHIIKEPQLLGEYYIQELEDLCIECDVTNCKVLQE